MRVYPFIAAEKAAGHTVRKPCALLGVSRSAYYAWSAAAPSKHARAETALNEHVRRIHQQSRGTYGSPRVHQQLRQEGVRTSRKRVARVMVAAGLAGRHRRRSKRTTVADGAMSTPAHDLLGREFSPEAVSLDSAWVGDITYIRTWEGWAYLATIIDLASRRVVGFAVRDHMRTELVTAALEMALTTRRPGPGLIFHSDRGSQYTSSAFRELLGRYHVRQSLSRPRQCWDNAVAESFFATLKTELIYRVPLPSVAAARAAVFEYIEVFYNRRRIQSALGYQTPAAYETGRLHQPETAPAA